MSVLTRSVLSTTVLLGLMACGNENNFYDDLVSFPDSRPGELEDPTVTDRVLQVTTPEVDVLFVVDNSCSMADNQQDLAENFPTFLEFFKGSGLDYHIGVTSTDIDVSGPCSFGGGNPLNGKLVNIVGQRWVENETLNPEQIFGAMVSLGTSGSGCEKGLGGAFRALEERRDEYNEGFYRDTASLHTVILSDEEDQTEEDSNPAVTLNEFKGWYDGTKDVIEDRTFSAVVCVEAGVNCYSIGNRYIQVSKEIGGIVWNIGDGGFSELLEQLGVQASGFKREYFLSQAPITATLVVNIIKSNGATVGKTQGLETDGPDPDEYYYYDEARNSIVFYTFVPDPLDEIVIKYTLLSAAQDPNFSVDVTEEVAN